MQSASNTLTVVVVFIILAAAVSSTASADSIPNLTTVLSISELLRLAAPTDGQLVYVKGFYQPGDGGEGFFRYEAENTQVHDGGMVIVGSAPNPEEDLSAYLNWGIKSWRGPSGRWIRIATGNAVNVRWYGAKGDGVQDDGLALTKAFRYFTDHRDGEFGIIFVPQGTYLVKGQITVLPSTNVVGEGVGVSVIKREDGSNYLFISNPGQLNVTFSNLTLANPERIILFKQASDVSFHQVEFIGGIVRIETGSNIVVDSCRFVNNLGKSAYASDNVDNAILVNNTVINPEQGGFNLSHHRNSYIANNTIVSDERIQSGYAGIRLPNSATNNLVENNTIIGTDRGIFVLTSSEHNTIRNNTIKQTRLQGIFVESSFNNIYGNTIVDCWGESVYVNNSDVSQAHHNIIMSNTIYDTEPPAAKNRFVALKVYGSHNLVLGNTVSGSQGRQFMDIRGENHEEGNVFNN